MTKTAREVIAESEFDDCECGSVLADIIVRRLDAAGFVIVPKEATGAMIDAGDGADYDSSEGVGIKYLIDSDGIASVYRAMIAAAPR